MLKKFENKMAADIDTLGSAGHISIVYDLIYVFTALKEEL